MRAGYGFNGEEGKINSEDSIGEDIGFYLYDEEGNPTFATRTGEDSASILLKGEMMVTDAFNPIGSSSVYYEYSQQYIFKNRTLPNLVQDESFNFLNELKSYIGADGSYSSRQKLATLFSRAWCKGT